MARLSRTEQLNRLQTRYNDLIKPVFVIAEDAGNGYINAIQVLNNGRQSKQTYKEKDFGDFLDSNQDCNVIVNDRLVNLNDDTLHEIVKELDTETLLGIINETADIKKVEQTIIDKIVNKIVAS